MHIYSVSGFKKKKNRSFWKIIMTIIFFIGLIILIYYLITEYVLFSMKVNNDSMSPYIKKNQKVLFLYERWTQVKKNDVILFQPYYSNQIIICRITKVPPEKYSNSFSHLYTPSEKIKVIKKSILKDMVFCEFDNEKYLNDSRMFGPVSKYKILAKVLYIFQ